MSKRRHFFMGAPLCKNLFIIRYRRGIVPNYCIVNALVDAGVGFQIHIAACNFPDDGLRSNVIRNIGKILRTIEHRISYRIYLRTAELVILNRTVGLASMGIKIFGFNTIRDPAVDGSGRPCLQIHAPISLVCVILVTRVIFPLQFSLIGCRCKK